MRTEGNTVALHICSCPWPGLRRGRAITRVSFRSARKCHAVAESLAALAFVAWRQPNETRARTLFTESLVIRRALGDQAGIAECERGLTALASPDGVA